MTVRCIEMKNLRLIIWNRVSLGIIIVLFAGVVGFGWGYRHGSESGKDGGTAEIRIHNGDSGAFDDRSKEIRSVDQVDHETIDPVYFEVNDGEVFNLAIALRPLDSLRGEARREYIADLFTYLAKNEEPSKSLNVARELKKDREYAYRVLVAEWLISDKELVGREEHSLRRWVMNVAGESLGLEVELTRALALKKVSPKIAEAWMDAHSGHVGRSKIFAEMLSSKLISDPDGVLLHAKDWTDWERKNYHGELLEQMAGRNHRDAWSWYLKNEDLFEEGLSQKVLDQWAYVSPSTVNDLVKTLPPGEHRNAAINASVASILQRSASSAMNWADELEDPLERQMAYETIYESVPKGIGAMIESKDGLPSIQSILPNGPLSSSGLSSGDRILEVVDAEGVTHDLYGKGLTASIEVLRGEPGTTVDLKVLRENTQTGQLEEHSVSVTRDMLIIGK